MTQVASSDTLHDTRTLKEKAQVAKSAVAELASEATGYATQRFGDLKSTAQEKLQDSGEALVDFVQRKPYQSIAIAAGLGFLIGLILKRR